MGAVKSKFLQLVSKIRKKKTSDDIDCNTLNINSTYRVQVVKGKVSFGGPAINSNKTIYRGKFEEEVPAAVTNIQVVNSDFKKTKRELKKLAKKLNRKILPEKIKRLISVNQKLICSDENIVKYFGYEIDAESLCLYVAFELSEHTIDDYIKNKSNFPTLTSKDVIKQLVKGVEYLHEIKILHRNLKPSKVLIKKEHSKTIVKICGFGVSKVIPDTQSSFSNSGEYGEPGYIAPEIYDAQERSKSGKASEKCYKKGSDIFQLGAVICYIQSNGHHVFSCQQVIQNRWLGDFTKFEGDFTLRVLVRDKMLAHECSDRPSAKDILRHPALWNSNKTIEFFHQTSNLLKDTKKIQMCSIESNIANVLRGNSWRTHLTNDVEKHLFRQSRKGNNRVSYDDISIFGLIRAIRNMKEHFSELPSVVTSDLGSLPDSYLDYWMKKFPELLIHTYNCMKVHSSESCMKRFYK